MSLGRKLARLSGTGLAGKPSPLPAGEGQLAGIPALPRGEGKGEGQFGKNELTSLPLTGGRESGASTRQTAAGPLHVHEQYFSADHCHGRARVDAVLRARPETIAALALDESLKGITPSTVLLLDTETTGLAGGTGTLPFVLGLGWFEAGRLRLEQLVLKRPGEELPILRYLEERLAQASCLVTYNGKTFDWPLLRNRFVMNRLKVPEPKPHLDLLHCARRVYRYRAGGARLVHLEEHVLGHVRIGDIPGAEIPERYFRFLRTGDESLITPVIEHNAHDLVLLAAMLGEMAEQFLLESANAASDQLGYAHVAARGGDDRRALSFARQAAKGVDPAIRLGAFRLIAQLSRRSGESREAVAALEAALNLSRDPDIHLELAKLYEHRMGNCERALVHAREAALAESREDHLRRVMRLERRIEPTAFLPL